MTFIAEGCYARVPFFIAGARLHSHANASARTGARVHVYFVDINSGARVCRFLRKRLKTQGRIRFLNMFCLK